jgi:glutathione-regulated potassium-efflux system protein KefB
VPVTTIDNDIEMIEAAERFGFRVYYGDGTRLDVLRAAGAENARLICICVEKKETATHILELAIASFPLARVLVRSYDRVHAIELLERGAHVQIRETYESAILFGRSALEGLERQPDRVAEVELEVRSRDRERFALQQQGGIRAGTEHWLTRPAPRPEPLVPPRAPGVAINKQAIEQAEKDDAGTETNA